MVLFLSKCDNYAVKLYVVTTILNYIKLSTKKVSCNLRYDLRTGNSDKKIIIIILSPAIVSAEKIGRSIKEFH